MFGEALKGIEDVDVARFVWNRLDGSKDGGGDPRQPGLQNDDGVFVFTDTKPGRYRVDVCRP